MNKPDYQLIIVGGGPAGLTAGLYAARGRLKTLLIEKGATGGQVLLTDWVDNYPAFPDGVTGFELMDKMTAHADRFGLEKKFAAVESLDFPGQLKTVKLDSGEELRCEAVILCTGARPRKIGVPGEEELQGKGVSYCATCDGPFYRDQEIAVVGGGNTAIQEAIHLTKFAKKVTVIHRRDTLRATAVLQEKALANEKIHFIWNAQVSEIVGTDGVEALNIGHNDGSASVLPVTGIFVLIGVIPNNEMLPLDQLKTDQEGFLLTDNEMCCLDLPGVYAAGDIRSKKFRQIINAAGEGANAELSAEHYLGRLPGWK